MDTYSMMHGCTWSGDDLSGWTATEKLDGCRAYWDGASLWTRGGCRVDAPPWFLLGLPQEHLDCELWAGRGGFQRARVATQHGKFGPDIRLMVFDAPQHPGGYVARLAHAREIVRGSRARVLRATMLRDSQHAVSLMRSIVERGGEGLVVRADTDYRLGRWGTVQKLKP